MISEEARQKTGIEEAELSPPAGFCNDHYRRLFPGQMTK
jgi:hypothetical protein